MEDGRIHDDQLTASTAWNAAHGPANARLNLPARTNPFRVGAWCRDVSDSEPWIQVDLGVSVLVTGIVVQGRWDHTAQWSETYSVQYSRDGHSWEFVKDHINQDDGTVSMDNIKSYISLVSTFLQNYKSL